MAAWKPEDEERRWDSGRILVWILIIAMVAIPLATRFGYLPHVHDPGVCGRSNVGTGC